LDIKQGLWIVSSRHIPYLKTQNAKGNHILIQPAPGSEPRYMMADDLNGNRLQKYHQSPDGRWKPGRMIIETSADNYQVWIHVSQHLSLAEKRFWLKKMNSDPGADPHHRWGRCPGFFNRKANHRSADGRFPLAKLIWVDWMDMAHIPRIPNNNSPQEKSQQMPPNPKLLHKYIRRSDYERENESVTDFAYALALARRNFSKQQIINRLLEERSDWTHHREKTRQLQYLDRTVSKVLTIIRATTHSNTWTASK